MTEKEIRQTYRNFPPGQTMSFKDFRKEVLDAQDPVKARQDLADIKLAKATMQINRTRIDKELN